MDNSIANTRHATLCTIAIVAIITAGLLGAATNAINGTVSPIYFKVILGVDNARAAAIAQGILEGSAYGASFAIVFMLVLGIASRGCVPIKFSLSYIFTAASIAFMCWCLGGIISICIAVIGPEHYRYIGVPTDIVGVLKFAWVCGSIWGIYFGVVLSTLVVCLLAPVEWRNRFGRRNDVSQRNAIP